MLAWKSRVTAIGVASPTSARTRRDDLRLGVRIALGDHRAMQGQDDAIGGQCGRDPARQLAEERLEGVAIRDARGDAVASRVGATSMPRSRQASSAPPSEWFVPA